jgi:hypothetical protein
MQKLLGAWRCVLAQTAVATVFIVPLIFHCFAAKKILKMALYPRAYNLFKTICFGLSILLSGRSVRVVVTMGMPAAIYRWHFRAHSVKSLERNLLGIVGIAPVQETLLGLTTNMKAADADKWFKKLAALGQRAE